MSKQSFIPVTFQLPPSASLCPLPGPSVIPFFLPQWGLILCLGEISSEILQVSRAAPLMRWSPLTSPGSSSLLPAVTWSERTSPAPCPREEHRAPEQSKPWMPECTLSASREAEAAKGPERLYRWPVLCYHLLGAASVGGISGISSHSLQSSCHINCLSSGFVSWWQGSFLLVFPKEHHLISRWVGNWCKLTLSLVRLPPGRELLTLQLH